MKFRTKLICVGLASLCSGCDFSLEELIQPSPFEVSSGPLSSEEIQAFVSQMNESLGDEVAKCFLKEVTDRASKIGDPETLDPTTVELLPVEQWRALDDKHGKRLILTQVIFNQAIPLCSKGKGK